MVTIQPDASEYGGQTVTGAAWPNIDESVLASAASDLEAVANHLRDNVVPSAGRQKMKLADSWEGKGADSALDEANAIIGEHEQNEVEAREAAAKLRRMEFAVAVAKTLANQTAEQVQNDCQRIMDEGQPSEGEDTRFERVATRIREGYDDNVRMVAEVSHQLAADLGIVPPEPWGHPGSPARTPQTPDQHPDGQLGTVDSGSSAPAPPPSLFAPPPPSRNADRPSQLGTEVAAKAEPTPSLETVQSGSPVPPDPLVGGEAPARSNPPFAQPHSDAPSTSGASTPPAVGPAPAPTTGSGTMRPQAPAQALPPGHLDSLSPATSNEISSNAVSPSAFGAKSGTPLEQFQKGLADAAKTGGSPQTLSTAPSQPLGAPPTTQPLGAAPPTAGPAAPPTTGGPPAPVAQAAGGPGGGAGPAPVAPPLSGGVPGGAVPLGPPPTPPPAAPVTTPPLASGAPVAPTGAAAGAAGGGGAQVAPIPVSAARAERDLAQRAVRRSGVDPMETARRIAAALNAPGMTNVEDFKFFWVTGLTADGKIVVANNYGIAYIPQQVHLPEQVYMASADESISPAERASWVNEPIVAVQRWAEHNGRVLRAVIATEDQLKNSDAGVHHEVLRPEDIPENGKMAGRDRLQVIAPDVSSQLAKIGDADLVSVLPPAPADSNPPEDRRKSLWDNVWKPLASRSAKRGERHLTAFVAYAAHAQEHALYAAHTAALPDEQRQAIREFIYWQHVGQLTADALAPA
uniref:Uncharacterized protein D806_0078 n=2 Tax=Mycolicibacterium smegmatis TaxID=1772 RepID=Y78_MYCSE|nr:RecName: Full=Uncharacterized protein D806_0078 [Mycolicibacterium smegmatis MKD8]ACE06964.1 hypothetical protein MSMEG0071R [Mycolicibacterium smegmatis MKD8]